jgi:NTE family protein
MSKTVSLVLGSGGARGLAHLGVIQYLEENGYEIKSIVGCSIGSAVGGFYCAGKLGEFEQWMLSLDKTEIVGLLDVSWSKSGLFKGEKVINKMKALIGETHIEDLPIPYTAVACDIHNEKEVWLNKGSLFDAIRASVSLPLFFTPFEINGVKLVDGGVLNPVPIAPTFGDNTDLTIAVNLGGPLEHQTEEKTEKENADELSVGFNEMLDKLKKATGYKESNSWGMYDVADKAFDTMQSAIGRQKIAAYPPDIEIVIPRNACGTLEFNRSKEMIDLGYQRTAKTV